MADDMLVWLRATIEGDKATAEAAVNEPRRIPYQVEDKTALYGSRWENRPVSDEGVWVYEEVKDGYYRGMGRVAAALCEDKGVVSSSGLDGGTPADGRKVDLLHIAIHDPRDTIARCEAELRILHDMVPVLNDLEDIATGEGQAARRPGRPGEYMDQDREPALHLLKLLAYARRHRPGYLPEWAPEGTTP